MSLYLFYLLLLFFFLSVNQRKKRVNLNRCRSEILLDKNYLTTGHLLTYIYRSKEQFNLENPLLSSCPWLTYALKVITLLKLPSFAATLPWFGTTGCLNSPIAIGHHFQSVFIIRYTFYFDCFSASCPSFHGCCIHRTCLSYNSRWRWQGPYKDPKKKTIGVFLILKLYELKRSLSLR